MTWQTELVQMLRTEIGDEGETPVYSDSRLERLIVNSGKILIGEYDFVNTYTITISTQTISPDPTELDDKDFVNLVIKRAVCMLARGIQRVEAGNSINVSDGQYNIDGTGPAREIRNWAESACETFENAVFEYKASSSGGGKAIVGPHRTNNFSLGYSPPRNRSIW